MIRTHSLTRLFVALAVAGAIGAQIPVRQGTAIAADSYRRNNTGRFLSAGLIGAVLLRVGGKKAPEGIEIPARPPIVPTVVKDCQTATLTGDANQSIYDVLRGDSSRFSGIRGLIGDCDEVTTSLRVDEPLTLLAPENGALAQVSPRTVAMLRADKSKLCELLKDHILIGRYKYEDLCRLADGKKMLLLSGNTVMLGNKNGKVTLNGIEVAPMDIAASNGWIHPVKGVLRTNLP
jgi:uncharacterized surface protein with fasciclin (FAS1) repeats